MLLATFFAGSSSLITDAAVDDPPTTELTTKAVDVFLTKNMIQEFGNDSNPLVEYYETYIDQPITVTFEIKNEGSVAISGINMTSPESNLTAIDYNDDWFTFSGDPNHNWSTTIDPGNSETYSYTFTPVRKGTYSFGGSNATFWNGTHVLWSKSNDITFKVYEFGETLIADQSVIFNDDEMIPDARVKVENEFQIKINITNYEFYDVNLTLSLAHPGNDTTFEYNATYLDILQNESYLKTGDSFIVEYSVDALLAGLFTLPSSNISYIILSPTPTSPETTSNEVELEVYEPIYEGNEWEYRVPLLSGSKYFQIQDDDGNLINRTELSYFNTTIEVVSIIINVTNAGIVLAENIRVVEPTYNDWVFDTVGVQALWHIGNLSQGETILYNYTIYPKINGAFKIEPTVVTYDFMNQETLEDELNYNLYSNILEIIIEPFVAPPDYSQEWWITIGISFSVIFVAAIPLAVTFLLYGKRKRTQKGT